MAADETSRTDEDEEFEDEGAQERGVGETGDEFDDDEDLDEENEEDEDENLASAAIETDRQATAEIGSEGGSQGDLEAERRTPRVMRGSEATTTGVADERDDLVDRRAGGGVGRPRQ
jgi:hypothetical protein